MQIHEVQSRLQVSRRYKIQGMDIVSTTVDLEGFYETFSIKVFLSLGISFGCYRYVCFKRDSWWPMWNRWTYILGIGQGGSANLEAGG